MSQVDSVVVDTREPDTFLELFRQHEDVGDVLYKTLESGDFLVRVDMEDPPIVFERKTPIDYVSSINSRRLETQVKEMYNSFSPEQSFLMIEGDMSDFDVMPHTQFDTKAIRGFTASLCARWQCIPLFCSDKVTMTDMVVRMSRKSVEEPSHTVRDPDNTPTEADDEFVDRALLQLDGVGPDTKGKLKKELETPVVESLFQLEKGDLTCVKGIGDKTAESILSQIRGE